MPVLFPAWILYDNFHMESHFKDIWQSNSWVVLAMSWINGEGSCTWHWITPNSQVRPEGIERTFCIEMHCFQGSNKCISQAQAIRHNKIKITWRHYSFLNGEKGTESSPWVLCYISFVLYSLEQDLEILIKTPEYYFSPIFHVNITEKHEPWRESFRKWSNPIHFLHSCSLPGLEACTFLSQYFLSFFLYLHLKL